MSYDIKLQNEDETLAFAAQFAAIITAPCTLFFYGELGAGKTTFVRGFLRALGVAGRIKSPTYTLVEPYYLSNMQIFHFDFYRIKSPDELLHLGLEDYLHANSICLIEWPEKASGFFFEPDIACYLEYASDSRQLRMVATSERGNALLCNEFIS